MHQSAAEFEVGLGTVTDASPDTLSRTTILSSSNSDSAVDFSSGTKDVFCTLPASKSVFEDAQNAVNTDGTIRSQNLSGGLTGAGIELRYIPSSDAGSLIVFDRSTTSYEELRLEGSVIKLREAGSDVLTVDGGVTTLTGNLAHASDFTLDVGGDLFLDADGGQVYFQDGGVLHGSIDMTSGLILRNHVSDADVFIQGNDGGSNINALTLDMSDAGTATFNHDIKLGDNGIAIFGDSSDLQIYHDGSDSYIQDAGTGDLKIKATAIRFLSQNDVNETMMTVFEEGAVNLMHNGSTKFSTTSTGVDVTGTVVASSGINITNGTSDFSRTHSTTNGSLQILDLKATSSGDMADGFGPSIHFSAADGGATSDQVAEINVIRAGSDTTFNIELQTADATRMTVGSGGVDVTGVLEVSSTAPTITIQDSDSTSTFNKTEIQNSGGTLNFNTRQSDGTFVSTDYQMAKDANGVTDHKFFIAGSEKARINSSGYLLVGKTDTSFTTNGTEIRGGNLGARIIRQNAEPLTLHRQGSDGDVINLFVDSTQIGSLGTSSSDLVLTSSVSDKDILFKGNDGGSTITALTLDMSASGAATFNDQITLGGNLVHAGNFTIDSGGDITLDADGADIKLSDGGTEFGRFTKNGNDFELRSTVTNGDFKIIGERTAGTINALTFDMSDGGSASFNSHIQTNNLKLENAQISQTSGDLTLDVAGDINLDADGGEILLKDGGTEVGRFLLDDNNHLKLKSIQSDTDILLQGNDGGSGITALRLDMSDAGTATFNNGVVVQGDLTVQGTTTTLNTATLDVEDKNITLNFGSGDTSGSANGAGITIQDAVDASNDATILWDAGNDKFDFSHPINISHGTPVLTLTDTSSSATTTITLDSVNTTIDSNGTDGDIIFKGSDGGSEITALTLDSPMQARQLLTMMLNSAIMVE